MLQTPAMKPRLSQNTWGISCAPDSLQASARRVSWHPALEYHRPASAQRPWFPARVLPLPLLTYQVSLLGHRQDGPRVQSPTPRGGLEACLSAASTRMRNPCFPAPCAALPAPEHAFCVCPAIHTCVELFVSLAGPGSMAGVLSDHGTTSRLSCPPLALAPWPGQSSGYRATRRPCSWGPDFLSHLQGKGHTWQQQRQPAWGLTSREVHTIRTTWRP